MFQKIGAKGEETVGDLGGLSLRPLVHIAQGRSTYHTTSTELGPRDVGAVRLVCRTQCGSLEHLRDRATLVENQEAKKASRRN